MCAKCFVRGMDRVCYDCGRLVSTWSKKCALKERNGEISHRCKLLAMLSHPSYSSLSAHHVTFVAGFGLADSPGDPACDIAISSYCQCLPDRDLVLFNFACRCHLSSCGMLFIPNTMSAAVRANLAARMRSSSSLIAVVPNGNRSLAPFPITVSYTAVGVLRCCSFKRRLRRQSYDLRSVLWAWTRWYKTAVKVVISTGI